MLKLNCDVKLRDTLLNKMMLFIDNGTYKKDDLEKIKYGLEVIYVFITKSIIIFSVSYFLGIIKYSLLFACLYAMLRTFACGLHANKSWVCTIASLIIFIIIPYLCKTVIIPIQLKWFIGILAILHFIAFAPADTKNRPIINTKKRKLLKIVSTSVAIIYFILMIFVNNIVISNAIACALLFQSIIISPLTYKIFKLPYKSYKNYKKGGTI